MEDYLHYDVQKKFKLKFILRFEYTKGRDTLYLSSGETEANFKKNVNKKLLDKLKKLFPLVKKIDTSTKPFNTVFQYK